MCVGGGITNVAFQIRLNQIYTNLRGNYVWKILLHSDEQSSFFFALARDTSETGPEKFHTDDVALQRSDWLLFGFKFFARWHPIRIIIGISVISLELVLVSPEMSALPPNERRKTVLIIKTV